MFWSERSEVQAQQSLRQTLAVLRRHLGPFAGKILMADREHVTLGSDQVHSDVGFMLGLTPDSAVEDLERATALYRGEFLEGLTIRDPTGQQWLEGRRDELRAMATKRFQWLLAAYEKAGRYEDAELPASRLIDIDPLAEEGHRALIRAYLSGGKRAMAVRQYQRCRNILARELSVEPAEATTALLRLAEPTPSLRAKITHLPAGLAHGGTGEAHNLPRQMTSLVGRDRELEEVLTLLRRYKLVTLTGPGGAGKTRLAIEVGFRLVDGFADGIRLVELASIADPQLVGEALCGALGVPVTGDRSAADSAISHINQKEILLILDNCEHLVRASADLVEMVVRACPSVSVLVTSRESLGVVGESLYGVPNLTYPLRTEDVTPDEALEYGAVKLFVERAAATIKDFALDEATAPAIASICNQVDGIPLAIELAVGRLKMMRPDWLAANLNASFLALGRSTRVEPRHHQTLQATLDWSYDLLDAHEQTLLRRLSVFAGGCSLASAMRVASGEAIDEDSVFGLLSSLAEKSLLVVDLSEAEPRYRLLETTRRYALDKLRNNGEPSRQLELTNYLIERFCEAGETWPRTPTAIWLTRYEPELDNVRASLEWAFAPGGSATRGVELASLSVRLWDELSLFRERERWSELAMLNLEKRTPPAIAGRLCLARTSYSSHGDKSGFSFADQAVAHFRNARSALDLGEALARAGSALLTIETIGKSTPYLQDALKVLEPLGPTKPLASCLRSNGVAAYLGGDLAGSRTLIERSLAVCRSVGDTIGEAGAQIAMAELDFIAGEVRAAINGVRRMLSSSGHNRRQATLGLGNLASYLLADGDTEQGRLAAIESLREASALGWVGAIVRAGEHLALVAVLGGEAKIAAQLLGYAEAFYGEGTSSREWTEHVTHQRLLKELSKLLSTAVLGDVMGEGSRWTPRQAVAAASAIGGESRSPPINLI